MGEEIHNVYKHLKTLDSSLWKNRELELLFTAIDMQKKSNESNFKYYLLPGDVDEMKGYKHLFTDYSLPPNLGIINGIIFSDIVPQSIDILAYNLSSIINTINFVVHPDDLTDYNYNGKLYKIWSPRLFMLNSCYQESGIKFLKFDKDIDVNTIGFILTLKQEMKYLIK